MANSPDLTDSSGTTIVGSMLDISREGTLVLLQLMPNQELLDATLVLKATGTEVLLNAVYTMGNLANSNTLSTVAVPSAIVDWGMDKVISTIQINVKNGEKVRVKYFHEDAWIPLLPDYEVVTGAKVYITPIITSKLHVECLTKTDISGTKVFQPGNKIIEKLDIYSCEQPINISASINDKVPFFVHKTGLQANGLLSIDNLKDAVNEYLRDSDYESQIPLYFKAESPGKLRIESFVCNTANVINKFSTSTPIYESSLPWHKELLENIEIENNHIIKEIEFKQTIELSQESELFEVTDNPSNYALSCDSNRTLSQSFSHSNKDVSVTGVDIYIRPIFDASNSMEITGSLSLYADIQGSPSTEPLSNATYDFTIIQNEWTEQGPGWLKCTFNSPIVLDTPLFWISVCLNEGELYWYLSNQYYDVDAKTFTRNKNNWRQSITASELESSLLSRIRICSTEEKSYKTELRRGSNIIKLKADNKGWIKLHQPQLDRDNDLQLVYSADTSGEVKLSNLRILTSL